MMSTAAKVLRVSILVVTLCSTISMGQYGPIPMGAAMPMIPQAPPAATQPPPSWSSFNAPLVVPMSDSMAPADASWGMMPAPDDGGMVPAATMAPPAPPAADPAPSAADPAPSAPAAPPISPWEG